MTEPFAKQLLALGLSDYEARIYSAVLQHSPTSASFIAKTCQLSRSSVYTTLNTLIGKGLIATTHKNEIKQFIAQDYASVEELLKKQQAEAEQKLLLLQALRPQFAAFTTPELHLPNVTFFEGQSGLKKIYLSMMREARADSTLYLLRDEFIWQPEWKFVFEAEWHERVKRIKVEKNIQTNLLVNPSPIEKAQEKRYRLTKGTQYKFLPKNRAIKNFALYVLGDVVSILSMEKNNLVGIRIVNRSLAENFVQMFNGLWGVSK